MKKMKWGFLFVIALPVLAQNPLSLRDAVRLALREHPSVAATEANAKAAETKIKQMQSGYLPRLNYQESFTRGNNPVYVFGSLLTQRQFGVQNFAIDKLNKPDFLNNFQSQLVMDQMVFEAGTTRDRPYPRSHGRQAP